jgi:hypothetical protein
MTSAEIRARKVELVTTDENAIAIAIFEVLTEIAAQLAEQNERANRTEETLGRDD